MDVVEDADRHGVVAYNPGDEGGKAATVLEDHAVRARAGGQVGLKQEDPGDGGADPQTHARNG